MEEANVKISMIVHPRLNSMASRLTCAAVVGLELVLFKHHLVISGLDGG